MTHPLNEPQDCAVCGRPLDLHTIETSDGRMVAQRWLHLNPEDVRDNHIPVPVSKGQVRTVYRCDFCNEDTRTAWTVPANDFSTSYGNTSVGSWCACDDCVPFAKAGDWDGLRKRALASLPAGVDLNAADHFLKTTYGLLVENINGPIRLLN